jgi:hypothetical protein
LFRFKANLKKPMLNRWFRNFYNFLKSLWKVARMSGFLFLEKNIRKFLSSILNFPFRTVCVTNAKNYIWKCLILNFKSKSLIPKKSSLLKLVSGCLWHDAGLERADNVSRNSGSNSSSSHPRYKLIFILYSLLDKNKGKVKI